MANIVYNPNPGLLSEQLNIEEKIQKCVDETVDDKLDELLKTTLIIEEDDFDNDEFNKSSLAYNIHEFSRLRDKYYLPLPKSFTWDDGSPGIRWEYKRYISCKSKPLITKVEVVFDPSYFLVCVRSDEYKLTKMKELCTEWRCEFQTARETMTYILQLKDLGFIK